MLSEDQISQLFDPPTDQRSLIRHYTLSASDLALIRRGRGDHHRLGYALMLCYLRYPGRPLRASEAPPEALVRFVAEQVDVLPNSISRYFVSDQNRRRHSAALLSRLELRPFGARREADLVKWLLPRAIEEDRLFDLAGLFLEECRCRGIVLPLPATVGRICSDVRHKARREIHRRLTAGLSADQCRGLDELTERRKETNQSWLAWLRQMPESTKAASMLGLIERLAHLRKIGIAPARGHVVHQSRLAQLTREAGRTTVQHIAEYELQRRHATLTAVYLDLTASLTDHAIDLFDRLVGAMFRKTEGRHARAFQSDGRAINEKVRLYARIGAALITARAGKGDPFTAIDTVIPWERFCTTVAEAEILARPEDFDPYQLLTEHYAGIRRWAPAFLDAFSFQSVPAAAPLMRAIELLREMNHTGASTLPKSPPMAFVRQRWARHVLPGSGINRRYYELCVLAELRDRLRAGDVWVSGSRQYRAFEDRLISRETLQAMQTDAGIPVAVEADFETFIAQRRTQLNERLAKIDASARGGLLPDVTLDKGVLKITPLEKSSPPEAEALAAKLYAMLPRIRITDLLSEVARWTRFTDCFTHLRTGETIDDPRILMAGLLADGLNLGLTRMAEACSIASLGQLAWAADWHICDETYALALRRMVDHQNREPLSGIFGSGEVSSSDGQFFRAGGFGRDVSQVNAHYGREPGTKFYTHISGRYAPFHTKVIAATASEAAHVLDGLLHHQGETGPHRHRHHTDGGGVSDHVFALCTLLGFQFAPRIPDLKDRRLYSFAKPSVYPALEPIIAGRIDIALIRAHWPDILRVATSIRTGTVTASLILRQLASYPRQNGLAAALRELGRLERTLFTLDWLEDPELRRQTGQELNKGEARNSLARAVFIHRLGEIRDRTFENQQHRASGLNLLVVAIILWNTRYLARAIATLRKTEDVPGDLLAHLSPLGWEHVNLTGDYIWGAEAAMTKNPVGLRPLRTGLVETNRAA
jgi:TnpA family transposase